MARRAKSWSETFRTYLARRGLTQQDAATALGVSTGAVSGWCNGGTPRESMRSRIAKWSRGEVPSCTCRLASAA